MPDALQKRARGFRSHAQGLPPGDPAADVLLEFADELRPSMSSRTASLLTGLRQRKKIRLPPPGSRTPSSLSSPQSATKS
jgi:hypothetical protein